MEPLEIIVKLPNGSIHTLTFTPWNYQNQFQQFIRKMGLNTR